MRLRFLVMAAVAAVIPPGTPACSTGSPVLWFKDAKSDTALFRIDIGGSTGYVDRSGKIRIPLKTRSSEPRWFGDFFGGVAGSDGLLNEIGEQIPLRRGTRPAGRCSEGRIAYEFCQSRRCKYGYLNCDGTPAIPAIYDQAGDFSEGVAAVRSGTSVWFIDREGRVAIHRRFIWASRFSDGVARVVESGPCKHPEYRPCEDERWTLGAPVKPSEELGWCRYSFIDHKGQLIFDVRLSPASDFSEGLAAVGADASPDKGFQWGFINKAGSLQIRLQYDEVHDFHEGLAAVRVGSLWGFIDKAGQMVVPPNFWSANEYSQGAAVVQTSDRRMIFIDRKGRRLFERSFEFATTFRLGLAHVKDGVWTNWIDRNGLTVFRH